MILFLEQWWTTWLELAPWMLLGMALAGILHVVVPARLFKTHLRGAGGVIKAVLVGIPLPLCSCGVIPAGVGLKKSGASDGAAVGFLISTPQTGVDSILVSASFLGWPFAFFKMAAALVTGVLGGWLVDLSAPRDEAATGDDGHALPARRVRPLDAWWHALEILRSIWIWLVIGVAISAAISLWLPREWAAAVNEWGLLASMLLVLAISLPWYVCATASIPVAASLVQAGFPTAAAMVFLMAGPATNIATMGAIVGSFGWRVLSIYLGVIVAGSMMAGWLFDSWLGTLSVGSQGHDHSLHGTSWWSLAAGLVLLALVGWLAGESLRRKLAPRTLGTGSGAQTFRIAGMHCQNCVQQVESAVRQLKGVTSAAVDLRTETARVVGSVSRADVQRAVETCGFQVVE